MVNLSAADRRSGARFDRFGLVSSVAEPAETLAIYFDDLTLNGEPLDFDHDPGWTGKNNQVEFDDTFKRGQHDFGYQGDTRFAGGSPGEIGGLIFSDNGGYYADDVGRLSLDDRLIASGRMALVERGSEAGFYVGWFDSQGRGYPPKNLLGVIVEGPNSVGSMFRPVFAGSSAEVGAALQAGPLVNPFGKPHQWKIEYDPQGAQGRGELRVSLDGERAVLASRPTHGH